MRIQSIGQEQVSYKKSKVKSVELEKNMTSTIEDSPISKSEKMNRNTLPLITATLAVASLGVASYAAFLMQIQR